MEFSIPDPNVGELLDDITKLRLYDPNGNFFVILDIDVTSQGR